MKINEMLPNANRALIIGGGVAGPVLALFLRRAGFAPEIFEATAGPSAAGGALGLAPNGMNVLAAGDVIEQVREAGVTASEWLFENQSGKVLASSPGSDPARYGQPAVMITRADLHRVLVKQAQEQGIPIHFNKSFVTLNDTPGKSVVAQFSDGSSAEGNFVVGADGIRSQVRQAIMPMAPKPVYTGMMAPGGFSPCLNSDVGPRSNQRVHFIFGQNGFFGYFNALTARRSPYCLVEHRVRSAPDQGRDGRRRRSRASATAHGTARAMGGAGSTANRIGGGDAQHCHPRCSQPACMECRSDDPNRRCCSRGSAPFWSGRFYGARRRSVPSQVAPRLAGCGP